MANHYCGNCGRRMTAAQLAAKDLDGRTYCVTCWDSDPAVLTAYQASGPKPKPATRWEALTLPGLEP